MSEQEVQDTIQRCLGDLGLELDRVLPVQEFQADLGVDSTEMVDLAAMVRTEFGLYAQRLDLRRVRTVADMVEQVRQLAEANLAQFRPKE